MFIQLIKYGLVGGVSTLIHIVTASLYIYFFHENIYIANALGFTIAFAFSYTVQSLYVFKHALDPLKLLKYFTVQFGALLVALESSNILSLENLYLQTVIISILLPIFTFIIHKIWTFKETEDTQNYAGK
ncbi:MAG: GtrA family protein [Sulfurimonas sp.]|nr:GtrA family protein [Sulfurimonas sp.]